MIYQNFRFMAVAAILLGLSNLSNLYNHCAKKSYCQFSSNNSHHCLIIHAGISSPFPPRATSSHNLPVQLLAPPALPSLGDCFPWGSVDLGQYGLYSSALSQRACWCTLLLMLLGGAGESSLGIGYAADNDADASVSTERKENANTALHLCTEGYLGRTTGDYPSAIIVAVSFLCPKLIHQQRCETSEGISSPLPSSIQTISRFGAASSIT